MAPLLVHARLPRLPPALSSRRPLLVGAAARLEHGGAPLHEMPEVWIAGDPAELADAVPIEGAPGAFQVGAWCVRAQPSDVPAALAARRVAIDAFAVRPNGESIDPLGGVDALAHARLDPLTSADIDVDPALVLRVPALASELGWRLADDTLASVADGAPFVLRADRDRQRQALTRLLVGRRPSGGLAVLERTGVLPLVLPEAAALVGFHRSSKHHHKDVWAHTRQVVMQAVPRATIRWAALLHDIGKTHTRSFAPGKKVHFFRHDELGALMFEGIAHRLRFPGPMTERIRLLILYHLRANLYLPTWSDAAVRRFDGEIEAVLPDLLALSRADVTSKRAGRRREAMANLFHLKSRVAEVRALDAARKHSIPKGLGTHIIQQLGVKPGPRVGELRQACEDAVRDGRLPASPDVEACIAFLRAQVAA